MKMKTEVIHVLSSIEVTRMKMPKYNAYAIGHGAFRNKKKYTRKVKHKNRAREEW